METLEMILSIDNGHYWQETWSETPKKIQETWDNTLTDVQGCVTEYYKAIAKRKRNPEVFLQLVLPQYWQILRALNIFKWGVGSLPSDSRYDVGIFLVGFSSLPIALSIAEIQPRQKIYFLHSEDTFERCDEITDRIQDMLASPPNPFSPLINPADAASLITRVEDAKRRKIADPSDPVSTFQQIKDIIDQVGSDVKIALDLTGGKKTMIGGGFTAGSIYSVAPECRMFYVDSLEYDSRRGTPIPGTEFLSQLENPYDVYNVQTVQQAKKLFEKHNYEAAADLWGEVEEKLKTPFQSSKSPAEKYNLKDEQKMMQSDLAMANCYKLWDAFDYHEAKKHKFFSFHDPDAKQTFKGSWGYNDKHMHNEIDVLGILSSARNREYLFAEETGIVHCAADYYQNAIRRKDSGELNDALVHFTQVIEILCSYKICRGIFLQNSRSIPDYFLNDPGTPRGLINFFFGHSQELYRNQYEVDQNEFLEIENYEGFNQITDITGLIKYRNNFVHVNRAMNYATTLQNANKLESFSRQLLKAFSCDYCNNYELSFEQLLELHKFRSASLSPIEQIAEELNHLTDKPVDANLAVQIYNDELPSLEGDDKYKIAQALKTYWQRVNKWDGGSNKQRQKVMDVKKILGES